MKNSNNKEDHGHIVYDIDNQAYFTGMKSWDKQLRNAKVYHDIKWANDIINT